MVRRDDEVSSTTVGKDHGPLQRQSVGAVPAAMKSLTAAISRLTALKPRNAKASGLSMEIKHRTEQETFEQLAALCASPGFIHALARISVRDNMVAYPGIMTPEAMAASYNPKRTIRAEFNTLLGLMLKAPVDFSQPDAAALKAMVERTYDLLEELHDCLRQPMIEAILDGLKRQKAGVDVDETEIFGRGDVLREPIFYGGESAYSFQYRDFALSKYAHDDAWLIANKGFGIADARAVVGTIGSLPAANVGAFLPKPIAWDDYGWSALSGYLLDIQEVATAAGVVPGTARAVLDAFTAPASPCNEGFKSLGDFNVVAALPLIRAPEGKYVSLQAYGVIEALYDSPFYWMGADKAYMNEAFAHRGAFTEEFAAERLATVFGASNVHRGVRVLRGGNHVTDVDVLVTFADRAIVLQCKAKRLTLEARRGNDLQLRDDFKKAVQHAYDQARLSAISLNDPSVILQRADGTALKLGPQRVVYPVCVVADHYPALAVQARQFLKFATDDVLQPPFATDVFIIDVMAEMLTSPLKFLSYLDRRVSLADKIATVNEYATLGYHLARNLWIDAGTSMVVIAEDFSVELDTAMTVRREGLLGRRTPKGILDRFDGTLVGRMLTQIELSDDASMLGLGFFLLTLDGETIDGLNKNLESIAAQTRRDGATHDLTLVFGDQDCGLTIHCSPLPTAEALEALQRHCEGRKYIQRAAAWFGLLVRRDDGMPKAVVELRFPWRQDTAMDEATRKAAANAKAVRPRRSVAAFPTRKIGRNERCPCGSGSKYKKCHGR